MKLIKAARLARIVFGALMVSSLLLPGGASAAQKKFVQDCFAIGVYCPPPTTKEYYKDIADANFTLVIGGAPSLATNQLKYCKMFGLKGIVGIPGAVEKAPDNDACWGYWIVDEPGAASFPDLAKRVEEIRTKKPGHFGYINLFPNYANADQLQAPTYEEHVSKFMELVKPEVLSMDHYPLMRPEGDSRDSYCANLETMRVHSLKAGVPFWNYFYSMPFNDRLDPTEAQLRWQMFTSVAYGAKGVLYFCYWTPGKGAAGAGEFPKGGAVITAEGLKTRHYDEARRINGELKNLGPVLMKLTNEAVYRVNTSKDTAAALAGSPVRSIARTGGDPFNDFIVGSFKHQDGRRAVMIVNHSYANTAWPTVTFDADAKDVWEVDKVTGVVIPLVDDSPELKGVQLSFGAGDGRLFLLPPAK